jgi:hypothetical protein
MRTKTLLIAAAALAAGIVSSQAQVYSQNVVGYANVPTPSSGINYLIACQFQMGTSNGVNEVFSTPLPDYSVVLLWDVPSQSYTAVQSDTSSPSGWDDAGYVPLTALPTLPVGQGFFFSPSAPVTNLFSGAVAVTVGTSNKMDFTSSGINYLVACTVPYSGSVAAGTSSGGGPNLNGLPDYTVLLLWDVPSQSYNAVQSDTSSPSGWDDAGYVPLASPPTISVGQGFFISPSAPITWTVGL